MTNKDKLCVTCKGKLVKQPKDEDGYKVYECSLCRRLWFYDEYFDIWL